MGAAAVGVLRLPLSCVVLASLLVSKSGAGSEPLIIVGVVVAYLVTIGLDRRFSAAGSGAGAVSGGACAASCRLHLFAWRRETRLLAEVAVPAMTALRATVLSSLGIVSLL
ncbi:MAG TPA: hypothetical protein VGC32_18350 [Solirubrobacterales bacterium]